MGSNPSPPLPKELWDVDRLAAYLGVGRRYVYRLTQEGRIRHLRVARQLRFDPADVAEYLVREAREVTDTETRPPVRRPGRPRWSEQRAG